MKDVDYTAAEREALDRLSRISPPPDGQEDRLVRVLVADGLLRRRSKGNLWLRLAAGVLIFLTGAATGAYFAPAAEGSVTIELLPSSGAASTPPETKDVLWF